MREGQKWPGAGGEGEGGNGGCYVIRSGLGREIWSSRGRRKDACFDEV